MPIHISVIVYSISEIDTKLDSQVFSNIIMEMNGMLNLLIFYTNNIYKYLIDIIVDLFCYNKNPFANS